MDIDVNLPGAVATEMVIMIQRIDTIIAANRTICFLVSILKHNIEIYHSNDYSILGTRKDVVLFPIKDILSNVIHEFL